jgi:chaperonin GroES
MKLQPLGDWAAVKPAAAEQKTASGIIIPDSAQEKPQEGTVQAIGPGTYEEEKGDEKKTGKKERKFIPTTVKPGDRVLYQRFAGTTYKIDGEEIILVREKDILGIISDK